ncbi:hypothetical protein EST38_g3917 [Candolleomyces aberdarensis]|uniref:Uncharacterized protein n=1 Tax=Candolleomyces aberdarensis TaxID=2316362 RepID=A0A4Q2DSF5_9AGAR|nr:hypothetical protein EST38_g3917 [Candolleomyces aberdarensis]
MITQKGHDIAEELRVKAEGRDPDAFDMYIYNGKSAHSRVASTRLQSRRQLTLPVPDFFPYATLDLVEKTLKNLHSKVTKKNWNDAYPILEGLTVFIGLFGDWTQCDDGDLVKLTIKTYGALAVAVLRGLKKDNKLDQASFPSLESLLHAIVDTAEMLDEDDADYAMVARGIARRLFKDKTEADFALEQKQREEWLATITDEEDRNELTPIIQDMAKENGVAEPWYMKGDVLSEDKRISSLSLTPVWKEYKSHLADVPEGPMKGPSWDIRNWSDADKRPFQFNFMGSDM